MGQVKPQARSQFFSRASLLMLGLVLASFSFTYFAPLATGSGNFSITLHIHGVAYFAWIFLYAWQTRLVATGNVARHRELGLAGIALSGLMVPLAIAVSIEAFRRRSIAGDANPYDFVLFNIVDITTFTVLMAAAIAAVTRHSDWHRRFAFGAALCLVGPSLTRWLRVIPEALPWTDLMPALSADLFLIALIVHDKHALGRVHRATWWVIGLLVPIHVATPFLYSTDWWRSVGPSIMVFAL